MKVAVAAAAVALSLLAGCGNGTKVPPNDPLYPEQTNLAAIYIEDAWRAGFTGAGVTIAVIDTGFNPHEDVDSSRISGRSYSVNSDGSVARTDGSYADTVGHGTSIVGLLAATRNNRLGIAGLTDANILVLKVDVPGAPALSYYTVAQAVRDAADAGCGVIDIGAGTPNASDTLKDACDYAVGKGCIVIAAAGGTADTPYYPAAYDSVIGVDGLGADLRP
ncbi:MAG: S8 family serine peptidase, partial [Firmicutes bacterium]|nr:S8 family serine peptidase [Bacillota bacterium]